MEYTFTKGRDCQADICEKKKSTIFHDECMLCHQGIEPSSLKSPAWQAGSLPLSHHGSPKENKITRPK